MQHEPTARTTGADALADALARIERRLARLEDAVTRIEGATAEAPRAVGAVVDTLDDAADALAARGVDVDERLRDALRLLDRLSSPSVTRALESALALAEAAPAAVATAADTFDDVVDGLRARGVDPDERLVVLADVMDRLTRPAALSAVSSVLDRVEELQYVLDSGVLDRSAVHVVAELGRALATSGSATPPKVGAFGALRAMSDPDVQRALGFTLTLARSFGASLRDVEATSPKALTEGKKP